jgi:hypothetical protein
MQDHESPLRLAILRSEKILLIIDPWIRLIAENKEAYPGFAQVLDEFPIHNVTIQKFILFCLLPFFYKANHAEDRLFIKVLEKVNPPKLDLERYVETCEVLYITCVIN